MVVSSCDHNARKKHGRDRNGNQRYRCLVCGKTFIPAEPKPMGAMRIPKEKAILALKLMLEGASVRTIQRLIGLNLHTLSRLTVLIGERCRRFMLQRIQNVQTADVQIDELWSYVQCKEKFRQRMHRSAELGDTYTFLGIDRESKLVLSHYVGRRDVDSTIQFLLGLREAFAGNCHITTDGFPPYSSAVPGILWDKNITFAQLIKIFGTLQPREEARYSPPPIVGTIKKRIIGDTTDEQVCTSHCERFNLSLRMGLKRFARLSNAFSKSRRHHEAAIALWICFYNFCRVHSTLATTPAVAAKLAGEPWTIDRLLQELATH